MESSSKVAELESIVGEEWRHISSAWRCSKDSRERLRALLQGTGTGTGAGAGAGAGAGTGAGTGASAGERWNSIDLSAVAFGSLARGEFTQGSDLDWALLVDGSASPDHFEHKKRIDELLASGSFIKPGQTGTFGDLVFSHDLVHLIGGDHDTNLNTTRRCLMLLESVPLDRDDAYGNVIRSIVKRYLMEDHGFAKKSGPARVPRFLLNDFARYWRTMAVDFAQKQRDRYGKGAALRNLKLRLSRKLLFASGLLTCFACELGVAPESTLRKGTSLCGKEQAQCVECLSSFMRHTPLEVVALVLLHLLSSNLAARKHPEVCATASKVFGAYDQFLGMLDDGSSRDHLERLKPEEIDGDEVFERGRALSRQFNEGMIDLFFRLNGDTLGRLTEQYGVF